MSNEAFYNLRTEMRKRLGRIIFYPQNIDLFVDDIIQLIEMNEEIFKEYKKNCTENEKKVLLKILKYLKVTNKNKKVEHLLE